MILCIKADSPDVYIGIWDGDQEKSVKKWQAGRELSTQILSVIDELCSNAGISVEILQGIVVFEGPGSYTGLRISISVANALAYSSKLPIIGTSGDDWIETGINDLKLVEKFVPVSPIYGGEVYTTKPTK